MYYIWAYLSYGFPIAAILWSRTPIITPLWLCLIFYFVEFGPHTFMDEMLRYAAYQPDFYRERFQFALVVANFAMAMGILVSHSFLRRAISDFSVPHYQYDALVTPQARMILGLCALLYCAIFLAADGVGLPRLREHVAFLFGNTSATYNEIRRELFNGSLVETMMAYTRQSTSALFVTAFSIFFLKTKNPAYIALISIMFLCCFLQLNKFPALYIICTFLFTIYLYTTRRLNPSPRDFLLLVSTLALLLLVLLSLYTIQYRAQLNTGTLNYDDLYETIIYRPFFNQSDTLRLWFEEFPERTEFLGISNISLLAPIFGLEFVDVTKMIPDKYVAFGITTFQVGFIGSGYASFGFYGVFLYGMAVTVLASMATVTYLRIRAPDLRAIYGSVIMLDMYFFFSRELSTALLSGGIVPALLIGCLFRAASPARPAMQAPQLVPIG